MSTSTSLSQHNPHVDAPAGLHTVDLSCGYGERTIVDQANVTIPQGKITVIVGANACGKSTLLKTMARIIPSLNGVTILDGKALEDYAPKALAQLLGMLPQHPLAPEGITVADLVGRARYPHHTLFRRWGAEDTRIVADSLIATGSEALAERSIDELSGGQRQRVWISFALAQRTEYLLLDEPTTFLDVTHQLEVLDLLTDLNQERETTIVMVLHDINLAARYADHIIAMKDGRVVAAGAPKDIMDAHLIKQVFDLDAQVIDDPLSHTPLIIPIGRHRMGD